MISSLNDLAPGNTFTVTTINNEVFTGTYMQCTELGNSQFLCLMTGSNMVAIAISAISSIT